MKKIKNQRGITLIALIITIIVMLILVAVTVSVAMNGGIFNNARDAKTGTQKAASKEELIVAMAGSYDSNGDFAKPTQLPEGTKWCKENETYENATNNPAECDWIITETGNKFYIDGSGSVLDEKPETVYKFSLNQLASPSSSKESGAFQIISKQSVWNAIGENISSNSDYCYGGSVFYAKPINTSLGYMIGFSSDDANNFEVCIVTTSTHSNVLNDTPGEGQMTYAQFLATYGNEEFKVVELSELM